MKSTACRRYHPMVCVMDRTLHQLTPHWGRMLLDLPARGRSGRLSGLHLPRRVAGEDLLPPSDRVLRAFQTCHRWLHDFCLLPMPRNRATT